MDQPLAQPVERSLRDVADRRGTGCLVLAGADGAPARVWLRDGQVYAVNVPGHRPMVGIRLLSSGVIGPEQLAEALDVQRRELPDWRVGELLVHLGFVPRSVVDAFVAEQVRDQMADLLSWQVASTEVRDGEETRSDVAPPVPVEELLAEAQDRMRRWQEISAVIGGSQAVPRLAAHDPGPADVVLGPHDWALLTKVDGHRDVASLAEECGFTLAETGQLLQALLGSGLLVLSGPDVPTADGPWGSSTPPEAAWVGSDLDPGQVRAGVSAVLAALADLLRTPEPIPRPPEPEPDPAPAPPPPQPVVAAAPHEASLLLTELVQEAESDRAPATRPTPAAPTPSTPEPQPPAAPVPAAATTAPTATATEHLDPADAAALLRELSTLGVEEATPSAPAAPRPTPAPAPEHKKKKRFFGH